ncbi:MAG TPA: hypothetical protein VH416_08390 [Gaiellaceae bacterium]
MSSAAPGEAGRELFVRHARRDGRSVALLRAIDYGDSCVVEAEVHPIHRPRAEPFRPGPYVFPDARQATAFVTEAVESLMYLGCEVHAQ